MTKKILAHAAFFVFFVAVVALNDVYGYTVGMFSIVAGAARALGRYEQALSAR